MEANPDPQDQSSPNPESASADSVRDALIAQHPKFADVIMTRDAVIEAWCREDGKSKDNLTLDDILAIRALPEWQNAS